MILALKRALLPKSGMDLLFWLILMIPASIIVWQAFDRALPVTVLSRVNTTPEVRACDYLKLRYNVKQHHVAEVISYRRLYDGAGVITDYEPKKIPPRTYEDGMDGYTTQILIPCTAQPGAARMVITACWERPFNVVHQIWPVCNTLKAIEFAIVKPKG